MTIYISVRSGEQVISRLKYLQLQANKYLSELNFEWLVSLLIVMESLIFENTDSMNIVCENCVSTCCLFVRDVGRWDEHTGSVAELVVSFGRPSKQ